MKIRKSMLDALMILAARQQKKVHTHKLNFGRMEDESKNWDRKKEEHNNGGYSKWPNERTKRIDMHEKQNEKRWLLNTT